MATILGTVGDDFIDRNSIAAIPTGLSGNDSIFGDLGADTIKGEGGNDTIDGGEGDDDIYGIKGENILLGGDGDDLIHTGRNTSEALGGDGFDTIVAQLNKGGDHQLTGGEDGDSFDLIGASNNAASNVVITDFDSSEDVLLIDGFVIDFASNTIPAGYTLSTNADGDAVVSFNDDETVTLQGNTLEDLSPNLPLFGQVDGTDGADEIGLDFTDAQGDGVTKGDDLIYANGGDDLVRAFGGDDTVHGGDGRDTIYGIKGNNLLHGDDGNDLIFSGRNTSELFGDDGDDELVAELFKGGDHQMTGGTGSDLFNLAGASNLTTSTLMINDFSAGIDSLEIDGAAINFNDLPAGLALSEDTDGNAVLSFNDDETVTFAGVAVDNLLTDPPVALPVLKTIDIPEVDVEEIPEDEQVEEAEAELLIGF